MNRVNKNSLAMAKQYCRNSGPLDWQWAEFLALSAQVRPQPAFYSPAGSILRRGWGAGIAI